MVLTEARPEGNELYRPAYAVAGRAEEQPMHSDLVDLTCETVTLALARAREAGEAWVDAHLDASTEGQA